MAHEYRVVIEDDRFENGTPAYHAFCPALKGCHTWGHSREEALANIREAAQLYVEVMRQTKGTNWLKKESRIIIAPVQVAF